MKPAPAWAALSALALSACGGADPNPGAAFGVVIWKEDTPVQRRAEDLRACELQAIGLTPAASQADIDKATEMVSAQAHDRALRVCLGTRGYEIVEMRICEPVEMPEGAVRPILGTQDLPPVDQVLCLAPGRAGFVAI